MVFKLFCSNLLEYLVNIYIMYSTKQFKIKKSTPSLPLAILNNAHKRTSTFFIFLPNIIVLQLLAIESFK